MSEESQVPLFRPQKVFIDKAVKDLPDTVAILERLGEVKTELIDDPHELKVPAEMTWAKKGLLLTRFKADEPLKEFTAMTESTGNPYYSLSLTSNCHLECTYCILQSYLANNPIITVYTNYDEMMKKTADQLERIPRGSVIGTGQIADSLALEELTEHHKRLIPFFGTQDRVQLELKTKTSDVSSLLSLDHNGQTVVSWSLSPDLIQRREEFKTAPIADRIAAMVQCQEAGYPIGFHLDPVIHHPGWEKNYAGLIGQIFKQVDAKKIAWVSIGTLRFPAKQVKIMQERFPKNSRIFHSLKSTHLRLMHYPEALRNAIYKKIQGYLTHHLPQDKIFYSMEAEQS